MHLARGVAVWLAFKLFNVRFNKTKSVSYVAHRRISQHQYCSIAAAADLIISRTFQIIYKLHDFNLRLMQTGNILERDSFAFLCHQINADKLCLSFTCLQNNVKRTSILMLLLW